jgi:hypothetical protein
MVVGDRRHAQAAFHPRKRLPYPLYRRLGEPQGRSGRVRKISPSREFDPRTVEPVASRYTDWAIPVPCLTEQLMVDCLTAVPRPGIDPGTFRLVTQPLNRYANPGSNKGITAFLRHSEQCLIPSPQIAFCFTNLSRLVLEIFGVFLKACAKFKCLAEYFGELGLTDGI